MCQAELRVVSYTLTKRSSVGEKIEGKEKERKGKRRRKSSFLLIFQRLNNESSMVKKRARLRSKR